MAAGRSLHVKCSTWDQVEAFYERKLRRGNTLSMRVPFVIEAGAALTLGLELPNQLVIAVDGIVTKATPIEGDPGRTWIEATLAGMTAEVLGNLRGLVADGRAGASAAARVSPATTPPPAGDAPDDERALFLKMSAELRRLRQLPVHEVLGVASDADPPAVRRAWFAALDRYHPDVVASYRSAALSHIAEELIIHLNRAYERMRASLVRDGRATARGAGLFSPPGWLIGFDDITTGDRTPPPGARGPVRSPRGTAEQAQLGPVGAALAGGSAAIRARGLLAGGKNAEAKEVLAEALVAHPRSRPLRSLYYVASALAALDDGQLMLATSQLETALSQDEACAEAKAVLARVRADQASDREPVMRLFR
ncbi:MAG: hypothetical protein KBG28_11765 [Kofleriaceae bacterium]|nr:hypothetical protein [Kofleriaceae bacterium]